MTISKHTRRLAFPRILWPCLALAAVCISHPAKAQANLSTESPTSTVNNSPSVYVTGGLGYASGIGPALLGEVTVGGEHVQVTARFSEASELNFLGAPGTEATEFGVMAGYAQNLRLVRFYALAGFGLVAVTRRGSEIPHTGDGILVFPEYERVSETVPSIPIQVGFDLGRRYVSGGLALTANLNSSQSYVGVLLTVNLGKLRAGR